MTSKEFGETCNWLMDEKEMQVTEREDNSAEQISGSTLAIYVLLSRCEGSYSLDLEVKIVPSL